MSAVSTPSPQTAAEQRAHEPSMEEILASIRRIIADDQVLPLSRTAPPGPQRPAAAPAPEPVHSEPEPELLRASSHEDHDPAPRSAMRRDIPRPQPAPVREEPLYEQDEEQDDPGLLSAGADASISSSFNALATSVMLQNTGMIEDSVRDLLRPMLKTWLDENLPSIVERLVRQEIERVARGRR